MLSLNEHIAEGKKLVESLKKRQEGVFDLIANLYSDPSHFIYELLQNAEDAYMRHIEFKGAKNVVFNLSKSGLFIYHNGKPFDDQDLISISTLAITNNRKGKDVNQIGKFGIGFKSVFSVCETPYLYSSNGRNYKIIDYVVLEEIEPDKNLKGFTTKFYLPFKPDKYEIIKNGLENIDSLSLLFLDQIREIEINFPDGDKIHIKKGNIRKNMLSISTNNVAEKFFIFSKPFEVGNQSSKVKIAYSIKGNQIQPFSQIQRPALFVYFLTQELTSLEIMLHGPFGSTPSREKVPIDDNTEIGRLNISILEKLSECFIESIYILKKDRRLSVNLWEIFPINEVEGDKVYDVFFKRFHKELELGANIIPTINGKHTNIHNGLLVSNKKIPNLLSAKELKELFKKSNWITDEISEDTISTKQIWKYLSYNHQIKNVGIGDLLRGVDVNFLRRKSDNWFKIFYALLLDLKEGSVLMEEIKTREIIKIGNGELVTPFKDGLANVFLPIDGFPSDNLVKKCFIKDELSSKFLRDRLKIKEPDKVDVVMNSVTIYNNPKNISKSHNTSDLNLILKTLADKSISEQKKDFFRAVISKSKIIRSVNAKTGVIKFLKPPEAYVSSVDNKAYFNGNPKFYLAATSLSNENMEKLGCKRNIKVHAGSVIRGTRYVMLAEDYGFHRRGVDLFDPASEMDGLQFSLKHINKQRSKIIWKTLMQENNPWRIKGETWQCTNRKFPIDEIKITSGKSKMGQLLFNSKWLYVRGKKKCAQDVLLSQLDSTIYDTNTSTAKLLADQLEFKLDLLEQVENLGYIVLDKKGKTYKEYMEFIDLKSKENELDNEIEPDNPINVNIPIKNEGDEDIEHPDITPANWNGGSGKGSSDKKHDKRDGTPREKRVFKGLINKYLSKGYILDSETDNTALLQKDKDTVEVLWLNSKEKNQVGYDFEIKLNGEIHEIIELKTTRAGEGAPFSISGAQWDKARDMFLIDDGDKYYVYCIYNADLKNPITKIIQNPYKKHKNRKLRILDVNFVP